MALFPGMSPRLIIFLRRLAHYAVYAAGGGVIVICLVALVLKFWFMPDVDRFRPDLEAAASRAVGVPVHIGSLAADWYGINPRLTLRDVRLAPANGEPLLVPKVEAIGSWWSLALLDLRLRRLNVEQARFPLRRASDGTIYLADIPLNGPGAPSPFPDWLLRQPRIVIKDAQVSWLDQKLGAPPLHFSQVRLLVENGFGRHRFGGVALPSAAAARVDVRGDFKGRSVHAPKSWSGMLYAQVSQASFERWGQWVPWAQDAVKSGDGDLRFWLTLERGEAVALSGDARLRRVAVSIRPDLPDLRFATLAGRIGWARGEGGPNPAHTLFVDKLRFKAPDAAPAEPASLRLTFTPDGRGGFRRIDADAGNLRLEALTALTGALPLPRRSHDLIEALNPHGLVESARGHWAGPDDYALQLDMRAGGARAYASFPGISGLDLQVQANQKGGKATLQGKDFRLDWPKVFRHELDLAQLDAQTDWQYDASGLAIAFQAKRLANADLDGEAQGRMQLPRHGSPVLDISAHLSRGEANAVYRYLPNKVSDGAYDWLRRSLVSGHSDDVRLILKGPLDRFPFAQGGGEFQVRIKMVDGVLDYAEGWPRIEGMHGLLLFHDRAMTLTADRGRILAASLGPVRVEVPDLHGSDDEMLLVDGHARGEVGTFLDFIRQSPVNEHTGHFTEHFGAKGQGVLALKLIIPLRRLEASTVGGAFTFQNDSLQPGGTLPELSQINGAITFTERSVQGHDLQLRVLDMPAQLDLSSHEGTGLRAQLRGNASAEALQPLLPAVLGKRIHGTGQWQASVDLSGGGQASGLTLSSNLSGLAVDLPAPMGKTAAQDIPLSIHYQPERNGDARLSGRYGTLAQVSARLPKTGEAHVNVSLGSTEPPEPREAGLWISGNEHFVDLDAWRKVDWGLGEAGTAGIAAQDQDRGKLRFRQASLSFNELRLWQRRLHDTHIQLQPSGKGWNLRVTGKEITGDVVTTPGEQGLQVYANFKRLAWPEPEGEAPVESPDWDSGKTRLANLEVNVQSLAWRKRELGELHLRLSPVKTGLQVDHFLLVPPEGRLEGSGLVSQNPRRPTQLSLKLSTQNLGKLLARFGYEDAVKGGEAELSGSLDWLGSPEDFDVHTLDGDLDLNARRGQFLKMDPGAGRLIGVLSLQSLPRRISLDFRDVFSQGFAFDEITGRVHLEKGSAYTNDLSMNGPAAKVRMSGVVNLANETQKLKLQIQPRLEDTVAVAGALLGGPAVGLGTLLANKVLKNPIGQAVSYEYAVSGTWADPVIAKVPRTPRNKTPETPQP
jgi:uncharacterized protein (TIGR02099 family)